MKLCHLTTEFYIMRLRIISKLHSFFYLLTDFIFFFKVHLSHILFLYKGARQYYNDLIPQFAKLSGYLPLSVLQHWQGHFLYAVASSCT